MRKLLVLHKVCNHWWVIYRYCKNCCATVTKNVKFVVNFFIYAVFSRICYCRDLRVFCVTFLSSKLRSRKSFDKYHVWLFVICKVHISENRPTSIGIFPSNPLPHLLPPWLPQFSLFSGMIRESHGQGGFATCLT